MELLMSGLRIAAAVYVGLCVLLVVKQSSYVYYPEKGLGLTPAYMNLMYEDVEVVTQDGVRVHAWWVPAPSNGLARTVLFCHGNAGNIADRLDSIVTFHRLGFHVLIFDYRGYGDSDGRPTEKGTYLDARAMWDHLTADRGIPPEHILIFGRSLGAAVAVWLAQETEPGAVMLESAFASARHMARRLFPYLPTGLLTRFRYDNLDRIGHVRSPVVVAHSQTDEMIPVEQGRMVFDAAPEPKLWFELQGGHNAGGLDVNPAFERALMEFLYAHGVLAPPDAS